MEKEKTAGGTPGHHSWDFARNSAVGRQPRVARDACIVRYAAGGATGSAARSWAGANDRVRVAIICVGARESAHVAEILSAANVEIAAVVDPDGRRTQRQGCGCSIPALTGKPGAASFAAGPKVLVAPIGEASGLME